MAFSLSTSCIKLCEIIFSGLICIDFLHIFFPDNKTRRKINQQVPDFLNILLFLGVLFLGHRTHPQPVSSRGKEGAFCHLVPTDQSRDMGATCKFHDYRAFAHPI